MIRYGPLDGWTDMIAPNYEMWVSTIGLGFWFHLFIYLFKLGHLMMIMKLVEEVISMYRHLTRVL